MAPGRGESQVVNACCGMDQRYKIDSLIQWHLAPHHHVHHRHIISRPPPAHQPHNRYFEKKEKQKKRKRKTEKKKKKKSYMSYDQHAHKKLQNFKLGKSKLKTSKTTN